MEALWDSLQVTSSRPYGTLRSSNFYPGLRPGLNSAVPAGLILQSVLTHTLEAQSSFSPLCATAIDRNRLHKLRRVLGNANTGFPCS
jgi:hypothetical protein